MRTRHTQRPPTASARRAGTQAAATASPREVADVATPQAIRKYCGWRAIDASVAVVTSQPLEPSRALANRMFNERALLLATAALPQSTNSARSAPVKQKPRRAPAAQLEGELFRQWTPTLLVPFGIDALNAYQVPQLGLTAAAGGADADAAAADMLSTVVALAHRQSRVRAAARPSPPPPIVPLFHDAAEEVSAVVAVPLLLALAEQELRGLLPGLTTRAVVGAAAVALRVLVLAERDDGGAGPTGDISAVGDEGALSAKLARVATLSETAHLAHHLCRAVNKGTVVARRRGNRSSVSSLSSSTRTSVLLDGSVRSQHHSRHGDGGISPPLPAPLSADDIDALVEPLFAVPPDCAATTAAPRMIAATSLRRALRALLAVLAAIKEVAVPLAAFLSSRPGAGSEAQQLAAMGSAVALVMRSPDDDGDDIEEQFGLSAAEALLVDDMAAILTATTTPGRASQSLPLQVVPSDLSGALKGRCGGNVDMVHLPAWTTALDWTMQVVETFVAVPPSISPHVAL